MCSFDSLRTFGGVQSGLNCLDCFLIANNLVAMAGYACCISLRESANVSFVGGVAEWSKAAVLKTVVPQGTVGSNPTSSACYFSFFCKKEK